MNVKEVKSHLIDDLKSALVQLMDAENKGDEADVERFKKHSLEIAERMIRICDIELNKEPKKKSLLNERTLFSEIYNALEEEEYLELNKLLKKLKP